jgi:NUMOD4 motif-containing protein/HNH endonuclease
MRHKENWMDIKGLEGFYQISDRGMVKSLPRKIVTSHGVTRNVLGGILRPNKSERGYLTIKIGISKLCKKHYFLHKMIAEAFIPNPYNKKHVNHKDGNKLNNQISNLEWVTFKENIIHAFENGLIISPRGEEAARAKLTNKQVLKILNSNLSSRELGKIYSVSKTAIAAIKTGLSWNHITKLPHRRVRKIVNGYNNNKQ